MPKNEDSDGIDVNCSTPPLRATGAEAERARPGLAARETRCFGRASERPEKRHGEDSDEEGVPVCGVLKRIAPAAFAEDEGEGKAAPVG